MTCIFSENRIMSVTKVVPSTGSSYQVVLCFICFVSRFGFLVSFLILQTPHLDRKTSIWFKKGKHILYRPTSHSIFIFMCPKACHQLSKHISPMDNSFFTSILLFLPIKMRVEPNCVRNKKENPL